MHTVRRGGVYYYRRRIPLDLVAAHDGKRQIFQSLRTKDRADAERKARRASVALDDRWAGLRGGATTNEELQGVAPFSIASTPKAPAPPSMSGLEAMLKHWQRERQVTSKTIDQYERAVAEFDEQHGSPAVRSITRRMVIAYRDKLQEQGKAVGTTNDRVSILRALLAIAMDRDMIKVNPAAAAALPPDKRAVDARKPYTQQQAAAVLAGTEQYREAQPARYWLPRLARWTGARLNELHQLRWRDLVERNGIQGINITDEGECMLGLAMRLKNAGSRRWVPLHAEIAGFWQWAQARPEGALFPEQANVYGIISDNFSKWYGRQRGRWNITDPRVTFHSWRHGFADMCRAASVAPEVRMALMGHAESGAAGAYGSGELPIKLLAEAIRRLREAP